MALEDIFDHCQGFQWDQGNSAKNLLKHGVSQGEAEQVFFNESLLVLEDEKHSREESRFLALGQTNERRFLIVAFTIRNEFVRVISARNMNRKERNLYEKT